MALFGYNKNDYDKNTQIFINRLGAIRQNLISRGASNAEVGRAISSMESALGRFEYSKDGDSKQKKLVDAYISQLLDKLQNTAQQKNTAKLVLQLNTLSDVVVDCRSLGKLDRSPEDLKAREILDECLGELNQVGVDKAEIAKRKQDILEECKKLDAMGRATEIAPLKNEYIRLESREKAIARKENELNKTYKYNCDALANVEDAGFYNELGKGNFIAIGPQQLEKTITKITQSIEINNNKLDQGNDVLKNFESNYNANYAGSDVATSSFDAAFEQAKAQDAMNDVNNSSFTNPAQSSSLSDDDFKKLFNS